MSRADLKLSVRYVVLGFIMYLAWYVIQPGYANQVKEVGEVAVAAIYGSIYGCMSWVLKEHFNTSIDR